MNKVIFSFILAVVALFFFLSYQPPVAVPDAAVSASVEAEGAVKNTKFFRKGDSRINCDDAPSEAVTNASLPESLRGDVQIECWGYGHTVGAASGYAWSGRIEQFGDIQVPLSVVLRARIRTAEEIADEVLPVVNHAAYFKRIEKRLLSAEAAVPVFQLYAEHNPAVPLSYDLPVSEIQAINNEDVIQRAYLITLASGVQTGYLCAPDCDAKNVFSRIEWKTQVYYGDDLDEAPTTAVE